MPECCNACAGDEILAGMNDEALDHNPAVSILAQATAFPCTHIPSGAQRQGGIQAKWVRGLGHGFKKQLQLTW